LLKEFKEASAAEVTKQIWCAVDKSYFKLSRSCYDRSLLSWPRARPEVRGLL